MEHPHSLESPFHAGFDLGKDAQANLAVTLDLLDREQCLCCAKSTCTRGF